MSKIQLHIDALQIESFDTVEASEERGTVRANEGTLYVTWCGQDSCDGTCYTHCYGGGCEGDNHGPTAGDCTQSLMCD